MSKETGLIPRKIWMLWFQGESEAPFIVRRCIDSWINKNPNWEVIVLDASNLRKYISFNLPGKISNHLCLPHQSDLIRLQLLSEYGGVWADATAFCMKPLDDWIDDYGSSGFFAFCNPGIDRLISVWFMASVKNGAVVVKLKERLMSFWLENKFSSPNSFQQFVKKKLYKTLNRSVKTTKYWFSPIVTKLIKIYPYFVFHYMFALLVSSNNECKIVWDKTKKVDAVGLHILRRVSLLSPVDETIKSEIDNKQYPVYKLTHKYDHRKYSSESLLSYLIDK